MCLVLRGRSGWRNQRTQQRRLGGGRSDGGAVKDRQPGRGSRHQEVHPAIL